MIQETLTSCPLCGNTDQQATLKVKDFTVSEQYFTIVHCVSCKFLFTNPRPTLAGIGHYYASEKYISHHDEAKDLLSNVYNKVREYTTRQKIKLINADKGTGQLLDMGSGAGYFLAKAKGAGWEVMGIEPDDAARLVAEGRVGETLYADKANPYFNGRKYNAITLWHVLEHVHELHETIEWLSAHLTADGKLYIAVPNCEAADAIYFREHWAAYDVPRHLYHFTKDAVNRLAEQHKFKVEKILPMWFDAYYVGMLSTRYQKGSTDYLKSFSIGSRSNWQGRPRSGRLPNTSSLIYVLSRK